MAKERYNTIFREREDALEKYKLAAGVTVLKPALLPCVLSLTQRAIPTAIFIVFMEHNGVLYYKYRLDVIKVSSRPAAKGFCFFRCWAINAK